MFGCDRPGRVLGLAAEALDELLVAGVAVVQDLDRDAAAELLVLGEVDVRHTAGAELAHDPVAPVEDAVDQGVGGHRLTTQGTDFNWPARIACMICFAIGAETEPPKPR